MRRVLRCIRMRDACGTGDWTRSRHPPRWLWSGVEDASMPLHLFAGWMALAGRGLMGKNTRTTRADGAGRVRTWTKAWLRGKEAARGFAVANRRPVNRGPGRGWQDTKTTTSSRSGKQGKGVPSYGGPTCPLKVGVSRPQQTSRLVNGQLLFHP